MQLISADEFKKKFGQAGLAQFSQPQQSQPQQGGYFSNVANQVKSNVNEASQSLTASAEGKMNPLYAGMNIAKNVSGAVLSPIAQAPGLKQMGEGFSKVGQAIVDTPLGQKGTDWLSKQASPETLGAVSDTIETGLNVAGIEGTIRSAQSGFNKAKGVYNDIKNTPPGPDGGGGSGLTSEQLNSKYIEDATPSYNKKMIGERSVKNPDGTITPRVSEGGVIKGRKINSTPLETEAGLALKNVPDYPIEGTKLQKYQAVQPYADSMTPKLIESLKAEKILRPPREIANVVRRSIMQTAKESLLLQSSDPIISKYIKVLENAIKQNDGTLAGELKVRQAMDTAYKNARGKAAFGSDTANALDEIHNAGRDALNKDVISHAKNTDVKAALKNQWDLYRASDVLKNEAQLESQTGLGRFKQKNPITSKVITGVGRVVGVGKAVDLLGN